MDSRPALEMVYQALHVLYHDPTSADKEKVNSWLSNLQKSIFAWEISNELLLMKRDLESCYFAAHTMRAKIQTSFHELPAEAHVSLRDSLLEHIANINDNTNKVIVTQLCLALADLALQMSLWVDPVSDLIGKFAQSRDNLWALLEILTLIPEEVSSWQLGLGYHRRQELRGYMIQTGKTVSDLLQSCLKSYQGESKIYAKIVACFTSWVIEQAIPYELIQQHNVLCCTFELLIDPKVDISLHSTATECVCSILQNLEKDVDSVLYQRITSLVDVYKIAAERKEVEKCANYCRIFTELGESLLDNMISNSTAEKPHESVEALHFLLMCVDHYDYEVAQITFDLWFRLSEVLYEKDNKIKNIVFRPYIQRLLAILWRQCKMDESLLNVVEEDGASEQLFKEFRFQISTLIKDVIFIVDVSLLFEQLFVNLSTVDWASIEVTLFVMQAVAKNLPSNETKVVPKIIEAILNLPSETPIAVKHTSILLLGELCLWINKNVHALEPICNFLFNCLHHKGLASVALQALKNICITCSKFMIPNLPFLVQLIGNLDSFAVNNDTAICFLEGISKLASKLPTQELQQIVEQLCCIQMRPLYIILETEAEVTLIPGDKTDPVLWIDRIASIFRSIKFDLHESECLHLPKIQKILLDVWKVLSLCLDKYQHNAKIVERICRALKCVIRCFNKHSILIVQDLVEQIVQLYTIHRHSSFLYLTSILVDEYGNSEQYVPVLLQILKALLGPTFSLLEQPNGLVNHPDTVDDLFILCCRFIQRAPVQFLQQDPLILNSIFKCALYSCGFDHKDANSSVLRFFYDLLYCSKKCPNQSDFLIKQQLVQDIISKHGQNLVMELLHAAVFTMSTYVLPDISDVLLLLAYTDRNQFSKWLWEAIAHVQSRGSGSATSDQINEFYQVVIDCNSDNNEVNTALRTFTRLYR